jgi:hypothetical protein
MPTPTRATAEGETLARSLCVAPREWLNERPACPIPLCEPPPSPTTSGWAPPRPAGTAKDREYSADVEDIEPDRVCYRNKQFYLAGLPVCPGEAMEYLWPGAEHWEPGEIGPTATTLRHAGSETGLLQVILGRVRLRRRQ